MVRKVLRPLLIFAVALWVADALFGPGTRALQPRGQQFNKVFERDLGARLKSGNLVVVDGSESDRYISEDLSTRDLTKALTFARLKSEVLEQPLFIENTGTFGGPDSVARVDPTDRKAWQELTLLEIDLKSDFARKNPADVDGYLEERALDPGRTPEAMVGFIDRYPDSQLVSTALAHLEYALCVARRDPQEALRVYAGLLERHADQPYLARLIPEYRERAVGYLQAFRQEEQQGSKSPK